MPEKKENEDARDPRDVDKYVDDALEYENDETARASLTFIKVHPGTRAEDKPKAPKVLGHTLTKQGASGEHGGTPFRKYSDAELRAMGIPTAKEEALEPEYPFVENLLPLGRFLRAPAVGLKHLFKTLGKDTILYAAKKGGNRPPARLPPKGTPERRAIEAARRRGVGRRKAEELKDIKAGGKGSGVWTEKELEGIRRTGEWPIDTVWHHDPTVANRPDLAADPRSLHILRGGPKAHLWKGHQGNYQNPRRDVLPED